MDPPRDLNEAFDLSTDQIFESEIDGVRRAQAQGRLRIGDHAERAALDDGIPLGEMRKVIEQGTAASKDLPGNPLDRHPGINFEGALEDGRMVRVKVTWFFGYVAATVHLIPSP